MQYRRFKGLMVGTILSGAAMVTSPALAQSAPPTAPSPPDNTATPTAPDTTGPQEGQSTVPSTNAQGGTVGKAQDIVITGTRIPQPNLTSASPVTVLSAQEIKLQGTTRTEDLINSLPQAFAAQGSNVSNGATGTATVNLRGLGQNRTLVLINGRRLQPGDPTAGGNVPDINFVPSSIIKRVDVLTGGASSVYGADAVAGVVNFIMDTNYRGFRIDAQASTFMHNNRAGQAIIGANEEAGFLPPHGLSTNGGAQDISGAFGAGFDDNRGSVVAYATYRKQGSVLEASRDYSFCNAQRQSGLHLRGPVLVLRRFVDFGRRPHSRIRSDGHHPAVQRSRLRQPVRRRRAAVQLRAVQLLPAAGRALHLRHVRRI